MTPNNIQSTARAAITQYQVGGLFGARVVFMSVSTVVLTKALPSVCLDRGAQGILVRHEPLAVGAQDFVLNDFA
jgi:hypothetical protein